VTTAVIPAREIPAITSSVVDVALNELIADFLMFRNWVIVRVNTSGFNDGTGQTTLHPTNRYIHEPQ
jgi:hypothetical protein